MKRLFSTTQIADRIGIAEHRITYAHRSGLLADAHYHVAGKRIYTAADLQRIAAYFGVKKEGI